MNEELREKPIKLEKIQKTSSLESEVKGKTDDILSSENIFNTINKLESSKKYNKIIKFIEEKLNLPFSNKIISDLYIILGRCFLSIGEIEKSLDFYKKARTLEKSNYLKASKEILKIYMIFLDTGIYSDDLEIVLNTEFLNSHENLEDVEFIKIETDYIEAFILIGLYLDANEILKKETKNKKALYLMENSMSNIISLPTITIKELQTIEYYFDNITKTEEIVDEYMEFKKSTKKGNEKYDKYDNMNYILFGKFAEEIYKETLEISKNIYKEDPELRLLLLSNSFLYNNNILKYKYCKEAAILICEILENTKIDKSIFYKIFNDDVNLYLKNDDLFIVGDLFFRLGNNLLALNTYISYYLSNKEDKETINRTKNFLEQLMLDDNIIKEKLGEKKLINLYKFKISDKGLPIYEENNNKIDFLGKIQEFYDEVTKSKKI
ncbi:MAG: hypothetical protein PHR68_02490 [Candidatus Gracilibacteria bacterium]|nr:hypothetical protein [Candidatus Gracilibacteria bacterium]